MITKLSEDFISRINLYLDQISLKNNDPRYHEESVQTAILEKIKSAAEITDLTVEELLERVDFNAKNLTIESAEAWLAEVRSILYLRDFGFTDIHPIKKRKKHNSPDFKANYLDSSFAVEVFCITQKHEQQKEKDLKVYKNVDPQFSGSKFGRDFLTKAPTKKIQLDSLTSDKKLLICVINSQPMVNFNDYNNMISHTKYLYEQLSWSERYYIGLCTGAEVNGKITNTIYPKLK